MEKDVNLQVLNALINIFNNTGMDEATMQTLTRILNWFNVKVVFTRWSIYGKSDYQYVVDWMETNKDSIAHVKWAITEARRKYVSILKEAVKKCISDEQFTALLNSYELTGEPHLYRDNTFDYNNKVYFVFNSPTDYLNELNTLNILQPTYPKPKPKGGSRRRKLKKTKRPTLRKNKTKRRR
jgi:hypothetical protein